MTPVLLLQTEVTRTKGDDRLVEIQKKTLESGTESAEEEQERDEVETGSEGLGVQSPRSGTGSENLVISPAR